MIKVGISGVPGSGKTTLARALASGCNKNVELVSEYARSYISKHKSIESVWEQIFVTNKQIEWEDSIVKKADLLITDSPIYLGFLFTIDLMDFDNPKDLIAYNYIFKKLIVLNNRYDIVFHLNPVFNVKEDGVRPALHFDKQWRNESNSRLLALFKTFGQKNIVVINQTDLNERVLLCKEVLK